MFGEEGGDMRYTFVVPGVPSNLYLGGLGFRAGGSLTLALAPADQALLTRVGGVVGMIPLLGMIPEVVRGDVGVTCGGGPYVSRGGGVSDRALKEQLGDSVGTDAPESKSSVVGALCSGVSSAGLYGNAVSGIGVSFSFLSGINASFSLLSGIGVSFSLWTSGLLSMTSVTFGVSMQMSGVSLMDTVEEISSDVVFRGSSFFTAGIFSNLRY